MRESSWIRRNFLLTESVSFFFSNRRSLFAKSLLSELFRFDCSTNVYFAHNASCISLTQLD